MTKIQIIDFLERPDTFSLGVSNGCQVLSYFDEVISGYKMEENESGRFESRFPTVKINKTNSIMLKGMEGCQIGVWVGHKEGKFILDEEKINIGEQVALQYIDYNSRPTEAYPHNPNGSSYGVAGLCSKDGRHLVMMVHPERTFLSWQLPYNPKKWNGYSPWIQMFKNAYEWCIK